MTNKTEQKSIGKRFSRVDYEITTTEDGEFWISRLEPDDSWGHSTVHRHMQNAKTAMESSGIDVESLIKDAMGGGFVLEHVLHRLGHEPDSAIGLAARIFHLCREIIGYQAINGGEKGIPSLAYSLGRLTSLAKIYGIDSDDHRMRRLDKPSSDPYDKDRNARIRAFYKRVVKEDGKRGAIKKAANEFGLSTKQISRILKE